MSDTKRKLWDNLPTGLFTADEIRFMAAALDKHTEVERLRIALTDIKCNLYARSVMTESQIIARCRHLANNALESEPFSDGPHEAVSHIQSWNEAMDAAMDIAASGKRFNFERHGVRPKTAGEILAELQVLKNKFNMSPTPPSSAPPRG